MTDRELIQLTLKQLNNITESLLNHAKHLLLLADTPETSTTRTTAQELKLQLKNTAERIAFTAEKTQLLQHTIQPILNRLDEIEDATEEQQAIQNHKKKKSEKQKQPT